MKKLAFFITVLLLVFTINTEAKQIQVNVLNFSFSPKTFTANIGDTIHFVWVAGFHTTTSTSVPSGALTWDSPSDAGHPSFLYPVKVAGNYSYKCTFHFAMGMVGSFTVPFQTKVTTVKATSVNSCSNTNSLQYKCTRSKPPFKVQLFRYGQTFGSSKTVSDTMPFTFSNLPLGSYYATAKGNNGTDSLSGKSGTSVLMPVPSGVHATHIKSTKATVKWTAYSCVKFYTVQYRVKGVTTWTKINTSGNKDSVNLSGLTAKTKYQFEVASVDSAHKIIATGKFSAIDSFTTTSSAIVADDEDNLSGREIISKSSRNDGSSVVISPNPAYSSFRVQTKNNDFISAVLRSVDGKVVWKESNRGALASGKQFDINTSQLEQGIYFLQLIDVNRNSIVRKIVVAK